MNIYALRSWVAAAAAAFLCGCANLTAVKEFGALSADAAGYTKLTEEYASSPARRKQYTLSSDAPQRQVLDRQEAQRKPQVAKLLVYHAALSEYMGALAQLADDGTANYSDEVGGLADAAVKAKYLEEDRAGAIKSLGAAIAGALTDYYRQAKIKKAVSQANAPLQQVLGDMSRLTSTFVESLKIERQDAQRHYRTLEAIARNQDKQSVAAERIWVEGLVKDGELGERVAAAEAYQKVLGRIGEAHQKLFDSRDKVDDAEVQRQLKAYAREIRGVLKAIKSDTAAAS